MLCLTESPSQAETPVAQTVVYVHDILLLDLPRDRHPRNAVIFGSAACKADSNLEDQLKSNFFKGGFLLSVNHFDTVVTLRCTESRQAASRISSTDPKTASNTLHF